ncbi:3-deoxy-7-phosphoheptulonate synthase [Candidatus Zixiibacteriota bacterium]
MADDHSRTGDIRVLGFEPLVPPRQVLAEFPLTDETRSTVVKGRGELREALAGSDSRLVIICGPCSIHDPESALEYAHRMAALRDELADRYIIVMRTYFEKPRTTIGWKGFIYDPSCDESYDINKGLRQARKILLEINGLGLPCATEFLDPIVPQYTADLVSWAAIGARTTESQTHRQMASGLSMPVGFKNSTDGNLQAALNAMTAATHANTFLGIDDLGQTSIVRTRGNPYAHIVLRGGGGASNYSKAHIAFARALLEEETKNPRSILVDCSHANSEKDCRKQAAIFQDVLEQTAAGESGILGMMIESYLVEGKQPIGDQLVYGQSITDSCIGWEQTEELLRQGYEQLSRADTK